MVDGLLGRLASGAVPGACFWVWGEQQGPVVACQSLALCTQDTRVTVTAVC
jgi:hypothetical protein